MSDQLDVVFAMDCTKSMYKYIVSAKENIDGIIEKIKSTSVADIHMAFVEYRDHPPQESSFVTNKHDFTSDTDTLKNWLSLCEAIGGGDLPEAVADALNDVLNLSWRNDAKKIVFLICDAPPHGLIADNTIDKLLECPLGYDPVEICHRFAHAGIIMYVIGCEPSLNEYKDFFIALAYITGGQYVPLSNAQNLAKAVLGGVQEEMSLQKLVKEVDEEISREIADGKDMDEDEVTRRVHRKLRLKGARSKQLKINQQVGETRECSKEMAKLKTLEEMKNFKPNSSQSCKAVPIADSELLEKFEIVDSDITEEQAERLVRQTASRRRLRLK